MLPLISHEEQALLILAVQSEQVDHLLMALVAAELLVLLEQAVPEEQEPQQEQPLMEAAEVDIPQVNFYWVEVAPDSMVQV